MSNNGEIYTNLRGRRRRKKLKFIRAMKISARIDFFRKNVHSSE